MDNGESSYRRFLNGDKDALTEIIRDYKDGLTFFVNGITDNLTVAEDIVQETFIKLYVKKPRFKGKSSFKTWLYRIGRNTAVDYLRHRRKADLISLDETIEYTASDYFREDRNIILHKAIIRLKPEYSQVLWLTYFEGMSNDEVTAILGKSKNNTAVLLHRAKEALKKELIKEGLDDEDL
ncbi:MAG: RNA polymerase sigma factor [Clostridia bacterium]|nr:RNA polymerase sigma factor [Clostridia bacterium]